MYFSGFNISIFKFGCNLSCTIFCNIQAIFTISLCGRRSIYLVGYWAIFDMLFTQCGTTSTRKFNHKNVSLNVF